MGDIVIPICCVVIAISVIFGEGFRSIIKSIDRIAEAQEKMANLYQVQTEKQDFRDRIEFDKKKG